MLEAVELNFLELLPFASSSYGSDSSLYFRVFVIPSCEGVQQGDPLGPLFFCLAIHDILLGIQSEFSAGYLDDISIGGDVEGVVDDVRMVENAARRVGLTLNHSKSEVIEASV